MEKILFKNNRHKFFEAHGFRCFDDFFHYGEGDTINQNTRRNVVVFKLADGDQTKTFFMKRFFSPHLKDMLFTLRNFGNICSQAELEWRNAHILLNHGIETYHPVCCGFRSVCGIERQSFFVTEEIDGRCLLDYLPDSWKTLGRNEQKQLVIKLAAFFKKIHTAGLSLPDAYIWHIFMVPMPQEDDYTFGIIDLHRMKIRTSRNSQAMDLGRFLFSLPKGFMDAELRSLFMEHYLAADFNGDQHAFLRAVERRERKLLNRRKKPVTSLPDTM